MARSTTPRPPARGSVPKLSVFRAVLLITLLCFVTSVVFAVCGTESEGVKQLRSMCAMGWQCGLASLLTLLGVRAGP